MHPVSMATAKAGQHQWTKALGKTQNMAAIGFGEKCTPRAPAMNCGSVVVNCTAPQIAVMAAM
jgi:hypothetical protein